MKEPEARCFKCGKAIEPAGKNCSPWDMPCDGVVLTGGGNYGSRIYDTLVDGVAVDLIVCDDCLTRHKALLRHHKVDRDRWARCTHCTVKDEPIEDIGKYHDEMRAEYEARAKAMKTEEEPE